MLTPVLIFVVASVVGAWACAQWLPDLAAGSVGGLAFFLVCGLAGATLGVVGMHIYLIVQLAEESHPVFGAGDLASQLQFMAFDSGTLAAFGGIVYLLAPAPETEDEPDEKPAVGSAS
jgi:hypothetical protein